MRDRATHQERTKLGLAAEDCLDHLDDAEPLNVLLVEEEGGSGMYGSWANGDSKLYHALVSVGFTEKAAGSGGSYGYGKAGLIRGSKIHSVLAYTCFPESLADGQVTQRLLGMAYWGPHRHHDVRFTGFARIGDTKENETLPIENHAADDFAASMGIAVRDPNIDANLGSSFLLVDPTVNAEDLCRAIEYNWWPAIIEGDFRVEIETAEGATLYPRPRKVEVLKPFIRGYEIATQPQDNLGDEEQKATLKKYRGASLGNLGLVADMRGWSYAKNIDTDSQMINHRSLVALTRSPHMVVEYLDAGNAQPYVRGAFVADEEVDDLLRQTEPKAHDSWQNRISEEGIDPAATKVANQVRVEIRSTVRKFMKQLKPPPVREQDVRLPLLDNLLKAVLDGHGKGGSRPPVVERPVSIGIVNSVVAPAGDDAIAAKARVNFSLSSNHGESSSRCRVLLRYVFDEDGHAGEECPITVDAPEGWVTIESKRGAVYEGDLSHEQVRFEVRSAPYDPDWSIQLIAQGDLIDTAPQEIEGTPS